VQALTALNSVEFLPRPKSTDQTAPASIFIEPYPTNAYGKVLKLELQQRLRTLQEDAEGERDTLTRGEKSSSRSAEDQSLAGDKGVSAQISGGKFVHIAPDPCSPGHGAHQGVFRR